MSDLPIPAPDASTAPSSSPKNSPPEIPKGPRQAALLSDLEKAELPRLNQKVAEAAGLLAELAAQAEEAARRRGAAFDEWVKRRTAFAERVKEIAVHYGLPGDVFDVDWEKGFIKIHR